MKKEFSFSEINKNNKNFQLNNHYSIKNIAGSWTFSRAGQYKDEIIDNFIDMVYFFNEYNILLLHKEKKWYRYVFNGIEYILMLNSPYMILSENKKLLCHIRYNDVTSNYVIELHSYILDEFSLKLLDNIFTGTNISFINNNFVVINTNIKRKLTFNEQGNPENRISKGKDNKKVKGNLVLYFDNIGNIDIYDKDEKNILYNVKKYLWVNEWYIIIKENKTYELLNLKSNKIIYKADILEFNHLIDCIILQNNFYHEIAVISKKTNELHVYDKKVYGTAINNNGKLYKKHVNLIVKAKK